MALAQSDGLQQQHQSHQLRVYRFASAARMRADQIDLQLGHVLGGHLLVVQVAKAGVDAVNGVGRTGHARFQIGAAVLDVGLGGVRQGQWLGIAQLGRHLLKGPGSIVTQFHRGVDFGQLRIYGFAAKAIAVLKASGPSAMAWSKATSSVVPALDLSTIIRVEGMPTITLLYGISK